MQEYQLSGKGLTTIQLEYREVQIISFLRPAAIKTDAKFACNDFTHTLSVHNVGINSMI